MQKHNQPQKAVLQTLLTLIRENSNYCHPFTGFKVTTNTQEVKERQGLNSPVFKDFKTYGKMIDPKS